MRPSSLTAERPHGPHGRPCRLEECAGIERDRYRHRHSPASRCRASSSSSPRCTCIRSRSQRTRHRAGARAAPRRRCMAVAVTAHSDGPGRGSRVHGALAASRHADVDDPVGVPTGRPCPVPSLPRDRIHHRRRQSRRSRGPGRSTRARWAFGAGRHDGLQALAIGATFEPDVVLLDLGMPELDGYETAREIRLQPWGTHVRPSSR